MIFYFNLTAMKKELSKRKIITITSLSVVAISIGTGLGIFFGQEFLGPRTDYDAYDLNYYEDDISDLYNRYQNSSNPLVDFKPFADNLQTVGRNASCCVAVPCVVAFGCHNIACYAPCMELILREKNVPHEFARRGIRVGNIVPRNEIATVKIEQLNSRG